MRPDWPCVPSIGTLQSAGDPTSEDSKQDEVPSHACPTPQPCLCRIWGGPAPRFTDPQRRAPQTPDILYTRGHLATQHRGHLPWTINALIVHATPWLVH